MLLSLTVLLLGLQSALCLGLGGRNLWLLQEKVLRSREQRDRNHVQERRKAVPAGGEGGWTEPTEEFFPQPLDHFNPRNPAMYKQRYWVNTELWDQQKGPVFLYIGGEGALTLFSVLSGEHVDLARKYRALLVSLEHRYYGASINPDGLTDENIQFLTSQQALADLATFHAFIEQQYNLTRIHRWVCFGGSYPGSLSAWFRLKFPHLVFAALASSAPVRAELDFTGYNKVVARSLSNPGVGGSLKCREAVAQVFSQLDQILDTGNTSRLEADFSSCRTLNESDDCREFASNLADIVMGTVQYNKEMVGMSIASLCRVMTNQKLGSAYQRLTVVNKNYMQSMGLQCVDNSHQSTLEKLRSTQVNPQGVGERQWYYQTCSEFGYYQTCEDEGCPLSRWLTLRSQVGICGGVFGILPGRVQSAIDFTNDYYGADRPASSRIIFVNGDIDPWHALSVLKNQSSSEVAIVINGTAHCADLRSPEAQDPPSLRQARKKIDDQIGIWLAIDHL
uniref:LOW QUALITY PROTEIN: thymus-specific serine protease n=1 Tax=Pristiophorus japonicus TaxID=55135 RepID=UPI00398EDDF2